MKNLSSETFNQVLDKEVEHLDVTIQARLNQARHTAVKSAEVGDHGYLKNKHLLFTLPFGLASLAAVLVIVVMIGRSDQLGREEQDLELLSSADTYELLQDDLAFYTWLEEQEI